MLCCSVDVVWLRCNSIACSCYWFVLLFVGPRYCGRVVLLLCRCVVELECWCVAVLFVVSSCCAVVV